MVYMDLCAHTDLIIRIAFAWAYMVFDTLLTLTTPTPCYTGEFDGN